MNKLINRISPETSENRILHAGFSIILMSEEITQTLSGLSSDMIIFILSGSITIYSTKALIPQHYYKIFFLST